MLAPRVSTTSEAVKAAAPFVSGVDWSAAAVQSSRASVWQEDTSALVTGFIELVGGSGSGGGGSDQISESEATKLVADAVAASGLATKSLSKLYGPVRLALSGAAVGVPVTELLVVLGRRVSIERLKRAVAVAAAAAPTNY